MKLTAFILLSLTIACTREQSATELLKQKQMRQEIMQAICKDSATAREMIDYLVNSNASGELFKTSCDLLKTPQAQEVLKRDTSIQNIFIENLVGLMKHDSVLCDKTCARISYNPYITRAIQKYEVTEVKEKR